MMLFISGLLRLLENILELKSGNEIDHGTIEDRRAKRDAW